jgi:heavy metal efflux system protein
MKTFFNLLLSNKNYSYFFYAILLALGLYAAFHLEVTAVPDVTNKQVVITTRTGTYTTSQIEKIITYPIESEMAGIQGVEEIRSLSKYGLSQVTIIFNDSMDLYFARQLVNQRIQTIISDLPQGIAPELSPVTTGLGEIFMWTLSLKKDSPYKNKSNMEQLQYLRQIQDFKIKPQLKKIQGVAEVDTNGGFDTEVHINFYPKKLSQFGLNILEVISALENSGISYGGGYIQKNGNQVTVLAKVELKTLDDIKNLPIKKIPSGKIIKASELADIRFDHSLRVGAATASGEETVLGTILMLIGADSKTVGDAAKEMLTHLNLPKDIEVNIVYDRQFLVDATINTVGKNLIEGALLVVFILLILLGSLRAALIVSLAIPTSMLFAFLGMKLFDVSANLMSLGAIDFGLLVDGSIVIVENYLRNLSQMKSSDTSNRRQLLIDSCREVSQPVIYGLMIIILVYIPIFSLQGIEGKLFHPMAMTVLFALLGSLIVAMTMIPTLSDLFIHKKHVHEDESTIFKKINSFYASSLNKTFKFKKIFLSVSILFFILAVFLFSKLGSDFVPQLNEGDMVIGVIRDSRQSIEESVKWQKEVEKIIMTFPEVEKVFSRIGTPQSATDPMGPNFADTFVILKKDISQWPKRNNQRLTKDELFLAIKEQLHKEMPNQDVTHTQPIEMRFNEILEGSRADVTMRIFGPDLEQLLNYITEARALLKNIEGVESIDFDELTGLSKSEIIEINVSPEKAISAGLNFSNINQQVSQSLAGQNVGYFFANENMRVPIIFHLDESLRNNIDEIKNLPIAHPDSGIVELNKLADIQTKEEVTTIARSWAERYSALSLYISGRDIQSVVKEAQAIIAKKLPIKSEYRFEWGGQFKNLERAQKRLMLIIPIILILILFIIYKMTESWVDTLIIFVAIPLGTMGGVFALFIRGMNFSVSAAVGFIALSGIVVLNSLVLVSFIKKYRLNGHNIEDSIKTGAKLRLRAIMTTALVASIGFLPMALGTGMGAEVQKPLATVVIGGLLTSTLFTLFIIPLLLALVWQKKIKV